MSRNIKTVKCLEKHVGKTVKVVDEEGHTFLATVEKGPCLWTTDKIADDSAYWWGPVNDKWGHHCVEDYQITSELKSLTLVSVTPNKEKKKKQEEAWTSSVWPQDYINKVFKTSEGKYIAFLKSDSKDGAGPAVCCFPDGSRGWRMYKGEKDTVTTGVPKEFFKVFKSAFFTARHDEYGTLEEYICSAEDTDKLQKIYEELNTEEEKKDFLSCEDIKKYTGHFCRLADGKKAFIAARKNCDTPVIILSDRFGDDKRGWVWHDEDADVIAPKTVLKNARYGWNVRCMYDAECIKVTGILEEAEPDKEESVKEVSISDMTLRELLEKLDEVIKR